MAWVSEVRVWSMRQKRCQVPGGQVGSKHSVGSLRSSKFDEFGRWMNGTIMTQLLKQVKCSSGGGSQLPPFCRCSFSSPPREKNTSLEMNELHVLPNHAKMWTIERKELQLPKCSVHSSWSLKTLGISGSGPLLNEGSRGRVWVESFTSGIHPISASSERGVRILDP